MHYRNYEALQRENAALKNQLGVGIQVQTSPLMPSSTKALPLEQREAQIQHRSHYEATTPASLTSDGVQQDFAAIRHHPGPEGIRDVRQDVPYVNPEALPQLQSRPIPRDSFPSVDNYGLKRTAEQAGLEYAQVPPGLRRFRADHIICT